MKLNELTGAKRLSQMTPAQAVDFIKAEFAAGKTTLRPLGKGALGVALTNGTDVFKFWYQDSAYAKFANFCVDNPSPWLPKFKSKVRVLPKFLKIGDGSANINYVKMELLKPFHGNDQIDIWKDEAIVKQIGGERNNFTDIENVFRWATASKTPRGVLKWLLDDHQKQQRISVDLQEFMPQVNPELLSLIEVMTKIRMLLTDDDRLDFGTRNMAMRGNQPVILDPIVNDDDIRINKEISDFLL
jgi:hypothetical protein